MELTDVAAPPSGLRSGRAKIRAVPVTEDRRGSIRVEARRAGSDGSLGYLGVLAEFVLLAGRSRVDDLDGDGGERPSVIVMAFPRGRAFVAEETLIVTETGA
jgi:hypothetical protein